MGWVNEQVARDLLMKAVQPVAVEWSLDEQATNALVDTLAALFRHEYSLQALGEMLVQIELNLDEELEGD